MNEMPTFMSTAYGRPATNSVWDDGVFKSSSVSEDQVQKFANMIGQRLTSPTRTVVHTEDEEEPMSDRRLVRVLVVDPHEDVPTDNALLYDSKEIFTDKTDQELYFDVPIAQLLEEHNAVRTKIVDKSVKERTEHLEPARIRDLKMLVITLAEF